MASRELLETHRLGMEFWCGSFRNRWVQSTGVEIVFCGPLAKVGLLTAASQVELEVADTLDPGHPRGVRHG